MIIRSLTRFRRLFTVFAIVALTLGFTLPASAAAPSNDDITGATLISALPFTDAINTSEATFDESDPSDCNNNGSVWYTFTPSVPMWLDANTFGSSYDTTLAVYSSTSDGLTRVGCNDDTNGLSSQVIFEASGGTTYYFLIGFCCGTGNSGGGGELTFSVSEASPPPPPPPPFDYSLTISDSGSVNTRTGVATVRGSVTCNTNGWINLGGELRQNLGRTVTIRGNFYTNIDCTAGAPVSWSVTVTPQSGKFAGGSAVVNANSWGCNGVSCDDASEQNKLITLRK